MTSPNYCDGCRNRRPCITRKSGVIYEGKDCEIHLCRWCRGHETRRSSKDTAQSWEEAK